MTDLANGETPEREPRERDPVIGQLTYGIPQAAKVLGISEKMIRVYVERGELKVRRYGSRVTIHRKELEKFSNRDHAGVAG